MPEYKQFNNLNNLIKFCCYFNFEITVTIVDKFKLK